MKHFSIGAGLLPQRSEHLMSLLPLTFVAINFRVEAPLYSSACRVILPLHRQSQGSPQSGPIPYRFYIPHFGAPIARSKPGEKR